MAVHISKIPHKLEDLLGREGTDEFVDFLNQAFVGSKEDVVQVVGDRFERRLVEETSKLRSDFSGLENKMLGIEGRLEVKISDLRSEIKGDIAMQTRWILVVMLAAGVLYPILNQIVAKILH